MTPPSSIKHKRVVPKISGYDGNYELGTTLIGYGLG